MPCSNTVNTWVTGNDFFEGFKVAQGGDVFVPTNNRYPHIHIGNGYIVYSKTAHNHLYLCQGDQLFLNRVQTVLQDSDDAHVLQICRFIGGQC